MIKIDKVSFSYEKGNKSIDDLSLHIKRGEVVVLCGRSGCGKTTVTRLINGLIPHFHEGEFEGKVIVDDKDVSTLELSDLSSTCGSMFQNPKSQFFNIDTTSELAFGCENLALDTEEIKQRITKTSDELELEALMGRNIFALSGGEKQQIAIGSIYAAAPDIYILDEPSSNMDAKSIERLRKILVRLKEQGKTIVISEHRLYFLLDLADRFLYFKEGKLAEEFSPKEMSALSPEELHTRGLRNTRLEDVKSRDFTFKNNQRGVKVKNSNCFREDKHVLSLRDLSFKENSVVAIIGENGAGKSTFIDTVSGFLPSRSEIFLGDRNMNDQDRVDKSFVVMQDVNRQLFCASVKEEIMLKSTKSEEEILRLMERLDIDDLAERHPASLSGGQKQRVAICSAFASSTEIMFYDEPTSGLDYKGMESFCSLVDEHKNDHKITFIITHDLELILGSCTHVLHLEKGQHIETYALDENGKERLEDFFMKRKSKRDSINSLKRKKQPLLKSLLAYSGRRKWLMYTGLVLSGISAVILLFPVISIWYGVCEIFEMYPNISLTPALLNYAYIAVGTSILGMAVYLMALLCTHAVAFRVARNMKSRSIHKLMDLPLGYFNSTGSGKIKRTLNETIAKTEGYLAHQMPDLIGAFVTPIAVLFFAFTYNWQLGLISIIPIILAYGLMALMMLNGAEEKMRQYQTALEGMNNEAVEYVRGISVVKTFGQSIFSFKKFHKSILEYKEFVVGYTKSCRAPMVAYQTLLGSISFFLVVGGIMIFRNTSDPKAFMLDFLFYLFFTPIYGLMMFKIMWVSQNTQTASDAVDRTEELLNERTLVYKQLTTTPSNFDIKFTNVSFSYPNADRQALVDINMEIKQGQTVALVGGSGGGKSTLATLIPRFWDVSEGSVSIGGIDVKDMSEEDIMDNVSFVFQNTNLYKKSILDNVKEGNPTASDEEVMEALKLARCEEIIDKMPNGIHTMVGTKGVYLSGGEAQRIAIARAILKDAPIILLDEATAFTDPENEHEIQLAMEKLAENKTVLMIAHRLSTIQNADKIYHIDNARIIEAGTHEALLEQKGKYHDMWNEYNNVFIWKDGEVKVND